jgi:8-oxo-dGTP pyrophosphatase MutT (NUDIX family)
MTHGETAADVIERHHTATAYVVAEGRTLLMWHEKLRMWLPPGGHCELNEDPVQAALREALEETGIRCAIIPPPDLLVCPGPAVLPPPAVILIEDIVRHDQPFHQHIDHVYFTRPLEPVDFAGAIPGEHPWRWLTAEDLAGAFSLESPDGTLVPVAEDVRLLGIRAIAAEGAVEPAHA